MLSHLWVGRERLWLLSAQPGGAKALGKPEVAGGQLPGHHSLTDAAHASLAPARVRAPSHF